MGSRLVRFSPQGRVVFFSSFLTVVPSDDSVTVFSFFSTVPSLLTFSLSVFETVRSHPTINSENATADIATHGVILQFFINVIVSILCPIKESFRWTGAFCHGAKPAALPCH